MGRKSKRKSKSNGLIQRSSDTVTNFKNNPLAENSRACNEPLLIKDRLLLPAYHPEESEYDEFELQLDFRPRPYFVSSLCYACSQPCELEFPCEDCHMVVYCSGQHRQKNFKSHKQLCKVLTEICETNKGLALAKNLSADEFRSFRVELLHIVELALGRRLELFEREILLYPRLCRQCHSCDDLKPCLECHMEYFCDEPSHWGNHRDHCEEFRIFRSILALQKENGFAAPKIPDYFLGQGDEVTNSFDEFMKKIYVAGCDYEKIDCASYAALSQAASPALTTFYALRNIQNYHQIINRKTIKIHIIGAELQFECANLAVWEKLFLHLLPGIKRLRLEFCGPELHVPADIAKVLENPRLCNSCRTKNRKIEIVFHCGKLYHEVDIDKPDMVCLFNPGLYRTTGFANQDTWPRTIEKFCDYGVPILVTSYTEIELPRDINRIREFRDVQIEQNPHRNPFASLKPERNFVSDDVAPLIYKNFFVSIARGIPGSQSK